MRTRKSSKFWLFLNLLFCLVFAPCISLAADTLSFEFQDIPIRTLIQLIGKNSGMNMIISDTVKGNMSLNLKDVTWQQALDIVLKANALGSRKYGNVMMIGPVDEIATNEVKQLKAEQQLADLAPLSSSMIALKYAVAADIASLLKGQQSSLLSPRGQVGTDSRTNSIWIQDTPLYLKQAAKFIKELDVPAKQVLIEARMVTIEKNYAKNLGVKFGLTTTHRLTGTLLGSNKMDQGVQVQDIPIPERLNFSMPANPLFGTEAAATIAMAVYKFGSQYLDLELSALEGENHAEIISNPRVITSNQQKAYIQSGTEIPYQEASASGATSTSFKDAVLSLEITPQITPNKKVVLQVKVTRNRVGANTTPGQPPSIDTEEVSSSVLLNNGQTVVIGGIYTVDNRNNLHRIPWLGTLPIIGPLFRHVEILDQKSELLVFLTPKIIDHNYCLSKEDKRVYNVGANKPVY